MEYTIFSIEDDRNIAHIINVTLSKQGYIVETFYDGKSFFDRLEQKVPNLILLDMMLPDIQGLDILKKIRSKKEYNDVDIIIVSANTMLMDKIDGLDNGADDYIEKPFNILELMSRVNVKARKYKKSLVIKVKDITLDIDAHICMKDNQEIKLTTREFDILKMLFTSLNQVVSRDEILKKIWNIKDDVESRTVDMHVKELRQKIDPENNIIKTIYGIGYKVVS